MHRFPENSDDRSDEQAEHFHRDIKVMEIRNQERWDKIIKVDYCWSLKKKKNFGSFVKIKKMMVFRMVVLFKIFNFIFNLTSVF